MSFAAWSEQAVGLATLDGVLKTTGVELVLRHMLDSLVECVSKTSVPVSRARNDTPTLGQFDAN